MAKGESFEEKRNRLLGMPRAAFNKAKEHVDRRLSDLTRQKPEAAAAKGRDKTDVQSPTAEKQQGINLERAKAAREHLTPQLAPPGASKILTKQQIEEIATKAVEAKNAPMRAGLEPGQPNVPALDEKSADKDAVKDKTRPGDHLASDEITDAYLAHVENLTAIENAAADKRGSHHDQPKIDPPEKSAANEVEDSIIADPARPSIEVLEPGSYDDVDYADPVHGDAAAVIGEPWTEAERQALIDAEKVEFQERDSLSHDLDGDSRTL